MERMRIGVLMERKLDADNLDDCVIAIEKLSAVEVQVNIRDSLGTVIFCRNTDNGELALDIYHHPWFHGFTEGGKGRGNHADRSAELAVS